MTERRGPRGYHARHTVPCGLDAERLRQLRAYRLTMGPRQVAKLVGVGDATLESLLADGTASKPTIERVTARLDELARERGAA